MAAALDRLMTDARVRLVGALDSAIQLELFNTLDEFFKETSAWTEEINFNVDAGETEHTLVPLDYGLIVRLVSVATSDEQPVAATMGVPGELVLNAEPTEGDTYTATVVMTVTDPTNRTGYAQFPLWTLEQYRQGILDGVLGKMMSHPGKPYTNERLAVYHLRRFRTSLGATRTTVHHQNLQDGQRWRFPRFA